jgi:hypothetical protein
VSVPLSLISILRAAGRSLESIFHLARYSDEQAFRYNNRTDMNDGDRLDLAVRQIVGNRLTYSELTGILLPKFGAEFDVHNS